MINVLSYQLKTFSLLQQDIATRVTTQRDSLYTLQIMSLVANTNEVAKCVQLIATK